MKPELLGQTVIITGAASGIGAATAHRFAQDGARVALVDMDEAGMKSVAESIRQGGGQVDPVCLAGNITDESFVATSVETLLADGDGIQGLVNVAGITRDARTVKMTLDDFRLVLDGHLTGSWLWIRELGRQHWHPAWKEAGEGDPRRFVTSLSSVSARAGNEGQANYTAAKGAIESLTKTIAREYAAYGVRVNAIAPGPVDTPMLAAIPEEKKKLFGRGTLLGRIAQPEEIAESIYKISTLSYVTGQILQVNAGSYLA